MIFASVTQKLPLYANSSNKPDKFCNGYHIPVLVMSQLGFLVTNFSPCKLRFNSMVVHVQFVLGSVVAEILHIYLPLLWPRREIS